MPRKKKEDEVIEEKKSATPKANTRKTTTAKKADVAKEKPVKKASTTKKTKVAEVKPAKKASTTKKAKTAEEKPTKKASTTKKAKTAEVKPAKKASTTKKAKTAEVKPAKKASTTKNSTSKKSSVKKTTKKKPIIEVVEYYDLPYRYNQTVVKILYQTPTTLFIYWDISDVDREKFLKQYGENFFNDTKPVLVVHNDTLHYSFEIEIDDFANSWYLHVSDSNCKYSVELGRRSKIYNNNNAISIPNNYLYITNSNKIESPNDHILFNTDLNTVYFMDVKTNIVTNEAVTSLAFIRNMGKMYSLYDLHFDKNDLKSRWSIDFTNPTSGNPSSTFR